MNRTGVAREAQPAGFVGNIPCYGRHNRRPVILLDETGGSAMRKLPLASVAIATLFSGSALAADMRARPVYKAPPPPPVYFSWTGCYVGGHAGALWATKDWTNVTPGSVNFGRPAGSHDLDSWLGGVQAGCDYQFGGGFVIGIAGDYAWSDAKASSAILFDPASTIRSQIDSLTSITGRIGFAWDRFLGYVKGGGAWEHDKFEIASPVLALSVSNTRSGWTVGIGGEFAFTNFVSAFIEYNYYDFGSKDHTFPFPGEPVVAAIEETKSVLKGGLNIRFGGWGKTPVAARY
jgi:outer membrane immunogenic protein